MATAAGAGAVAVLLPTTAWALGDDAEAFGVGSAAPVASNCRNVGEPTVAPAPKGSTASTIEEEQLDVGPAPLVAAVCVVRGEVGVGFGSLAVTLLPNSEEWPDVLPLLSFLPLLVPLVETLAAAAAADSASASAASSAASMAGQSSPSSSPPSLSSIHSSPSLAIILKSFGPKRVGARGGPIPPRSSRRSRIAKPKNSTE